MTDASLIAADESLLIVIDVQAGFLEKLATPDADALVTRIAWLARVAVHLGIPLVATEEEPERHGTTDPRVAASLPATVRPMRKEVFGLADQPDILAVVDGVARQTAVLVGLETDVCVAHSAIGLAEHGLRVVVIGDATGAPADAHMAGLDRIRAAGILVSSTKGAYYEWVRTLERAYEVGAAVPPPPGVAL